MILIKILLIISMSIHCYLLYVEKQYFDLLYCVPVVFADHSKSLYRYFILKNFKKNFVN